LWVSRVGRGSSLGGIHWGMAADAEYVYAPLFDLPALVVVDIQPITASSPGVVALDLNNGEIVWRHTNPGPACEEKDATCLTANSAAPTVIPGAVFSGSNDGIIRALSTSNGDVIWEFQTDRKFDAINGVEAHGGAVDGPGSLIIDGTLFVLSGYSTNYSNPGNVLLAFE
jgi:polyvinyl alcohol dehydrogenase (cytochrome)